MNSIPAFDTSEDDDFSFIVVDRMTADDSDKIENEIMASVRGLSMNRTLGNSSRSVFFSEDSSSLPPGVVPNEELISSTFHGHASLPLDVQQRMESLIEDNSKLQVTVDQTNFALKQMMMTLSQWRMDTETLRQDHKEKFQETRNLVLKLKEEKAEMRIVIEELNKKIQELEATSAMPSLIETVVPAVSDLELESVINDLKSKLEVSEATHIAEKEKNEAYSNKLTDLNDKIKVLQRELEALRPEIVDYQMKESRLLEELKLLREENSTLHCKLETFSSLERHSNDYQSAQTEGFTKRIDELTTKLMYSDEQVVQLQHEILLLKEREKLMDDGCEELRTAQSTVDRLRIRADSMTAVIVDLEDKNAFNTQKILKLEAENNELKRENEAIGILQAQVEVYRTDFLAERDARERLVGEKEHLAADLRRLHRLNVTLVEREQRNPSAPESESGQEFEQPTETADQAASTYRCPVCGVRTFRTLDSLNEHIDGCLNPAE